MITNIGNGKPKKYIDDADAALAASISGKAPTSHASSGTTYGRATSALYGHAKASSAAPIVAGTAAVGTDDGTYARGTHVHPAQTSVSGNAGTATRLASARNLSINGESAVSFNGTANAVLPLTRDTAPVSGSSRVITSGAVYTAIQDVKTEVASVYKVKGSIATYAALIALTDAEIGDVYNVTADGSNYVCIVAATVGASSWDKLSETVDLSPYAKTADVNSQLAGKQATVTGAATTVTSANLTALRAVVSNSSGKIAASAVTSAELDCLSGIGSSVQSQIDGKAPTSHASSGTGYGAASASVYGHAMASSTAPKAAGTAAVGSEVAKFARGDHVHPMQTSVSGNAGTATRLTTARTIAISGGATGTATSFNGTANITIPVTALDPAKVSQSAGYRFATDSEKSTWNSKMDAMSVDSAPTQDSANLVTSGGVYSAIGGGSVASAAKLTTARTVRTNLASTSAVSFDGTANIVPGVTGVLPVGSGGTGQTSVANIRAGKDGDGNVIASTYGKLAGGQTWTGENIYSAFAKFNGSVASESSRPFGVYQMVPTSTVTNTYSNVEFNDTDGTGIALIGGHESLTNRGFRVLVNSSSTSTASWRDCIHVQCVIGSDPYVNVITPSASAIGNEAVNAGWVRAKYDGAEKWVTTFTTGNSTDGEIDIQSKVLSARDYFGVDIVSDGEMYRITFNDYLNNVACVGFINFLYGRQAECLYNQSSSTGTPYICKATFRRHTTTVDNDSVYVQGARAIVASAGSTDWASTSQLRICMIERRVR